MRRRSCAPGIAAVPRGQVEAGLSLGLSRLRIIRHIILAPALRAIYPALGSQFVLQLLGSSLVSAIAAEELTAVSNNIMMQTFRNFEVFLIAGGIYLFDGAGVPDAVRGHLSCLLPLDRAETARFRLARIHLPASSPCAGPSRCR